MISRLVNEKGVVEYFKACKIVKQLYPKVHFTLIGSEVKSVDRVSDAIFKLINSDKSLDYIKSTDNILRYIQSCHVYVLPSYHEGMPRSVLEAMSVGRPIITTNANGCRDTVSNTKNGFIIDIKNINQLVDKMIWFIKNKDKINQMGVISRNIIEDKFDVTKINNSYIKLID